MPEVPLGEGGLQGDGHPLGLGRGVEDGLEVGRDFGAEGDPVDAAVAGARTGRAGAGAGLCHLKESKKKVMKSPSFL